MYIKNIYDGKFASAKIPRAKYMVSQKNNLRKTSLISVSEQADKKMQKLKIPNYDYK